MFCSYFLLILFSNRLVFSRFLQYYWYSYFFLMSLTFMLFYFLFLYPQCLCCFFIWSAILTTMFFLFRLSVALCNSDLSLPLIVVIFYRFVLAVFSVCFLALSTSFGYFFLFSISSILLNFSHALFLCPFCCHFLDCFSFYFRF